MESAGAPEIPLLEYSSRSQGHAWEGWLPSRRSLLVSGAPSLAAVIFCLLWISNLPAEENVGSFLKPLRFYRTSSPYRDLLDVAGVLLPPVIHAVLAPENLKDGRVIVVGDIHGCLEELRLLLRKAEYNADSDTLIAAGDLVDKGPYSLEVLEELRRVGALSVRGNHDDEALAAYEALKRGDKEWDMEHSRGWLRDMSHATASWLEGLPWSLSLPSHGLVVVHAGLVPQVELTRQYLSVLYDLREVVPVKGEKNRWAPIQNKDELGKGQAWANIYEGPDHVVFGHDSGRGFQDASFATGIDTGCVNGDYLTALILPPAADVRRRQNASSAMSHGDTWLGSHIVQVKAKQSYRTLDLDQ